MSSASTMATALSPAHFRHNRSPPGRRASAQPDPGEIDAAARHRHQRRTPARTTHAHAANLARPGVRRETHSERDRAPVGMEPSIGKQVSVYLALTTPVEIRRRQRMPGSVPLRSSGQPPPPTSTAFEMPFQGRAPAITRGERVQRDERAVSCGLPPAHVGASRAVARAAALDGGLLARKARRRWARSSTRTALPVQRRWPSRVRQVAPLIQARSGPSTGNARRVALKSPFSLQIRSVTVRLSRAETGVLPARWPAGSASGSSGGARRHPAPRP